jgi:hypothetical protein
LKIFDHKNSSSSIFTGVILSKLPYWLFGGSGFVGGAGLNRKNVSKEWISAIYLVFLGR